MKGEIGAPQAPRKEKIGKLARWRRAKAENDGKGGKMRAPKARAEKKWQNLAKSRKPDLSFFGGHGNIKSYGLET